MSLPTWDRLNDKIIELALILGPRKMANIDNDAILVNAVWKLAVLSGALIHKNRDGSKHEGRRICPTIGDFGGNCASNQSTFNNERIKEWEEEKKKDREGMRIAMVPPKVTPQLPKPKIKVKEKIVKAEVVDEHIEKIQDF
ncbi:hypothetical protein Tco_1181262 [Tanacetum coccineum]